jgi:hypothetical protein
MWYHGVTWTKIGGPKLSLPERLRLSLPKMIAPKSAPDVPQDTSYHMRLLGRRIFLKATLEEQACGERSSGSEEQSNAANIGETGARIVVSLLVMTRCEGRFPGGSAMLLVACVEFIVAQVQERSCVGAQLTQDGMASFPSAQRQMRVPWLALVRRLLHCRLRISPTLLPT